MDDTHGNHGVFEQQIKSACKLLEKVIYNNYKFFGAGCDSPPAVQSATREKRLIRCDSGTDSIVWMREEIV